MAFAALYFESVVAELLGNKITHEYNNALRPLLGLQPQRLECPKFPIITGYLSAYGNLEMIPRRVTFKHDLVGNLFF